MITLVDQSEADKLKFHCDQCDQTFVQSTRAFLDLHSPRANTDAAKLGIPPCIPRPIAAAPASTAPRVRKAKAPAAVAPAAPKKRGRPRKVETL